MFANRKYYSFALFVALRYLFSKKRRNAINIISFVAACGVCIGTMAMVCVMSVFNGFEQMAHDMFGYFDPDLRIESAEGKYFSIDSEEFAKVRELKGVQIFCEVLEDNALLVYGNRQTPATVKGVAKSFAHMVPMDSILYDGECLLYDHYFNYGVLGIGLASKLGLGMQKSEAVKVYAPKREGRVNMVNPERSFCEQNVMISGVFANQQEYDNKFLLMNIHRARELFQCDSLVVSAVELSVEAGQEKALKRQVQTLLGGGFVVRNRYEQHTDLFRIMQIEKWITFLILSLILLIATFNIIGSLSMLIIDKRDDIVTLHNLGASNRLIKQIFLFEGWMISVTGALVGLVLGVALCLSQQCFGWLKMGSGFLVEEYPVVMQLPDLLLIVAVVVGLGFVAACYPIRYLNKKIL